jgi:hypothetical protein
VVIFPDPFHFLRVPDKSMAISVGKQIEYSSQLNFITRPDWDRICFAGTIKGGPDANLKRDVERP